MVRAQKRENQDLNPGLSASKSMPDHPGQVLKPEVPIDYVETEGPVLPPSPTLESTRAQGSTNVCGMNK